VIATATRSNTATARSWLSSSKQTLSGMVAISAVVTAGHDHPGL
jgi:hypothetical protein